MATHDDEYPQADQIAAALAKATGRKVTGRDYRNWMEPESSAAYLRFDRAVKSLLGKRLYEAAETSARLFTVLEVKLGMRVTPAHEHKLALSIIRDFSLSIPTGLSRADIVAYVCQAIEGSQTWALTDKRMLALFDELRITPDVRSTLKKHIPSAEWREAAELILTKAPHHPAYLPLTSPLFAHFQDLVDAYVGPFDTLEQIDEHRAFCAARGDGAVFMGAVTELPKDDPCGAPFTLTPQEDRDFQD